MENTTPFPFQTNLMALKNLLGIAIPKGVHAHAKKNSKIRVPQPIISQILGKLKTFENERGYLLNSISLQKLALDLGTNYNYLSKCINAIKGKNFATYINDLRVDYIFEELKQNRLFRKYSVKAIAFEIGFNSTECFSKSFHRKFGIYPSEYLKSLNS